MDISNIDSIIVNDILDNEIILKKEKSKDTKNTETES